MLETNKIPHLKMYRTKTHLPTDKRAASMYNVAFLNTKSVDASINLMNSQVHLNRHKYLVYFLENIYKEVILGRSVRKNITKERQDINQKIKSEVKGSIPIISLSSANKRNMYFDMSMYNQLFFEQTPRISMILKKAEAYTDYMNKIVTDSLFNDYKTKFMLINLEDWGITKDFIRIKTTKDNPVFYIYMMMYRSLDKFQELGDFDIIFTSGDFSIRINPSLCDKSSYLVFRKTMSLMGVEISAFEEGESENSNDIQKISALVGGRFNLTGEANKVNDMIESKVSDVVTKDSKLKDSPEDVIDKLNEDKEFVKKVLTAVQEEKTGEVVLTKRDLELRERQKDLLVKDKTLEEILKIDQNEIKLETMDIGDKIRSTNENVKKVRFPSFEKTYNEHLMTKDTISILKSLNDGSIPVHIRDIKVEDTSDKMNHKETYTVSFEDSNRVRHSLKFDMPKFIDDKFMYLNGNKKMFVKQFILKPIVKMSPDSVQIVSNYKKIFVYRMGQKVSTKIEKFRKAIHVDVKNVKVKYGSSLTTNKKYRTTIEYDEISKSILTFKAPGLNLYFNQDEMREILKEKNIKSEPNVLCIGFDNNQPIYVDVETQTIIGTELDIIDYILEKVPSFKEVYGDQKTGKKFIYTKAKLGGKFIGVSLLISYFIGISGLMRRANIQHYFTETRPRIDDTKQGVLQFSDGYLVYDKYPFENSLLMNAFFDMPTKAYEYTDFDDKEVYLSWFDTAFKRRNLGPLYDNFRDLMIDPITKEVLEDLNLPTDFIDVLLYASKLLVDNSYTPENDFSLYRVRSNEMANTYLYQAFSGAYERYRTTANNNNPVKMSVPRDTVLKNILMSQMVEDYSTLNPIVELEKSRAASSKGPSGMNLSSAFTQDKRSYDKSMLGLVAMSTSPDANVGIVRQLTMEPNIIGPRGYMEIKKDKLDDLADTNLFSPAEMLSPLGASRDDSIRTAMSTKQSKHIIPIEKSSPVLISNGAEQAIHYHLSDDFSVVAKQDGKVIEVNDETGIVVLEYKDKTHHAININPRVVKNGAGGFYLTNQLTTDYKLNQTFKKNDVIAYDSKFFSTSHLNGNRFNIGSLQAVAVMGGYATYEDSTFITNKMSQDMASDIVMEKSVTLGKNANIDYIVKVGDDIKVGDELLRFEHSFEDDSLNAFLSNVGDELKEEIKSLGKTPIKSKYTGKVVDIKIYSAVDLDDMSPSLRKLVAKHYDRINKVKNQLDKYDESNGAYKLGVMVNEPTEKVESPNGKIKGTEVGEGVLIEFFIQYRDTLGVGDKVAFFTALKSIIGEKIPEGFEPYALSKPDQEISSVIAPGAILARMTPSILLTMFGNKVLVELKSQLQEIYEK